ncbi:MAG TPA: branched-chain amino acid ABC transporter permease [Candidatus Dormibacteraeota bacterium]|nr:branched-chain amino acid ABC transporter permease [Candidatus Dormibacteraeota bacterium]
MAIETAEPATPALGSFAVATAAARRRERILYIVAAIVLAVLIVIPLSSLDAVQAAGLPLVMDRYWFRVTTLIAMFVIIAGAWNIIGGLTGYPAFGNVVFFGIGAYTAGTLITRASLPYATAVVGAVVVCAAVACVIGLPLLRLRGHYFAVASLGVAVATGEVINNVQFFGGASGIFMPIIRSDLLFYYLMLGGAVLTVGTTWLVLHSRFGFGLIAIREDEVAAGVIGVNTTRYKVAAYMLSAALTGLAGAIYAQWNVFIDQSTAFNLDVSIDSILMVLIGGIGTIFGPVIGAAALEFLIQTFAGSGELAVWTQIGLGVLLTAAVIFLPRGIVDFFGGRSSFTREYVRRTLRETGV